MYTTAKNAVEGLETLTQQINIVNCTPIDTYIHLHLRNDCYASNNNGGIMLWVVDTTQVHYNTGMVNHVIVDTGASVSLI